MKTMPNFFVERSGEFLKQEFTEKCFPAGIIDSGVLTTTIYAYPVIGIENRLILTSKGIRALRSIGFRFQFPYHRSGPLLISRQDL